MPTAVRIARDFNLDGGIKEPGENELLPSPIRDAAPDAWGRRAMAALQGHAAEPDDVAALLRAGTDRIGALSASDGETAAECREDVELAEIRSSVRRILEGAKVAPKDAEILRGRLGVGGMRPKALLIHDSRPVIAKFKAPSDQFEIVRAEFAAMTLAARCGVDTAPVSLVDVHGDPVLLVERFDRAPDGNGGWIRRMLASGLTVLGLEEMFASYASYEELLEQLVAVGADGPGTAIELFRRMTFNVLCGNTDDHARNHSALWNGQSYELAPAYDICPQNRAGNEASQGMILSGRNRMSTLAGCVEAAVAMGVARHEALQVASEMAAVVREHYAEVCDMAGLTAEVRCSMLGRQFLNPFAFEGFASS